MTLTSAEYKELYAKEAPPPFGKELKKYFGLDPEYANLNHGSYGTPPTPVSQAAYELSQEIERNPDKFHRITYMPKLIESRAQLAKLIGAHTDECVLVNNATTGVYTVLRNIDWEEGDVLFALSTTYAAVAKQVKYLADIKPHPKISAMPLVFPTTHEKILEDFRACLRAADVQVSPNNKRVVIIDSIISNPGILLPWKEMVKISREEGVYSIVDAAHSIGQEVDIDLEAAKPDFWVSNCHKWLFSRRSCAVLYIPFRNQHLIKTSIPTSEYYKPLAERDGDPNILAQFEWNGTIDFTAYLTIPDALAFRQWLGGEHKINAYCHSLALQGGKYLAELWGTELMDPEGTQTLNMVNVRLPLPSPSTFTYPPTVVKYVHTQLLVVHKVYSAWFLHNGELWTRCSAQVFNDISDFERVGKVWLDIAKDITQKFGEQANDKDVNQLAS
ncbi:PLP-dependent transferase [Coprinopsis marcescibilis]|uniref:PLP-dependent transferase n=1 Tax=Coprinopsis marcescibilis TaxID=230819 RepID=A0A5C3KAC4_COPMA|nr:PLP-dependent transferase [Coprinopsis marcescibilis]